MAFGTLSRSFLVARCIIRDCVASCARCGQRFKPAVLFPLVPRPGRRRLRCWRCAPQQALHRIPREHLFSYTRLLTAFRELSDEATAEKERDGAADFVAQLGLVCRVD